MEKQSIKTTLHIVEVLTGQRLDVGQPGTGYRHTMGAVTVTYDAATSKFLATMSPNSCGSNLGLLAVDSAQVGLHSTWFNCVKI